ERHNTEYFTPNDERQTESLDIVHHYLTLLLDGKLYLAPLGNDLQKVLDVGSGDGIWAIDYADENPNTEVIGTDLSPMQELTVHEKKRESSTASISSSILEYRTINGRTFHSERHNTEYFTPNDERQTESLDIVHHYLTLLLDGKLYLAPLGNDLQKVLDVGSGDGIWAIDYADENPNTEVIGTDLSPMQPKWVPPNVKFELDDATQPWTWPDNEFDFVHMRFLNGAIRDWPALFREAFRCCKPGGYIESGEFDPRYYCDDGTADDNETIKTWNRVFEEGEKRLGNSFTVIEGDTQDAGIRDAGFEDVNVKVYKVTSSPSPCICLHVSGKTDSGADFHRKAPVGPWTADKKLAKIGRFTQLTLENDMEGYTLFLCTRILNWSNEEYHVFLAKMRKVLRSTRNIHIYCKYKYVYGRKPLA
ncbi:Methyltransferase domain, partial [Geosmithia morbida]